MALFSIKNSCFATIGLLAFATAACSSGSDSNDTGPATSTGGSGGGAAPTAGNTAGGAGGAGGVAAPPVYLYTFTDPTEINLAVAANTTAVANDLTPTTVFSWDSADGAPDKVANAGSLRIEAPFSAYTQPDQAVDFQFLLEGRPVDLTGKTLFMYLKLDSGFSPDPSSPGGLIFYAKSTDPNWDWGQAAWANLDPAPSTGVIGKWIRYTFVLAKATSGATNIAPFDPAQVMAIGIKIDTGTPTVTPMPAPPTAATFHLDSVGYQ
jgi:hypothetical protein